MKKKFVLTLALVLMVAASLMAATPLEVSGAFKTGYTFTFASGANGVKGSAKGTEGDIDALVAFTGDFWKVTLDAGPVAYDQAMAATANIYLDKALAAEGVDMGDLAVTLTIGNKADLGGLSVYSNSRNKIEGLKMNSKVADAYASAVQVDYGTMVSVYAGADIAAFDTAKKAMVLSAKTAPVDGIKAAVAYTNYDDRDVAGKGSIAGSVAVDVKALADLDFGLTVSAYDVYLMGDKKNKLYVEAKTVIEDITAWAEYRILDKQNDLYAKVSYAGIKNVGLSAFVQLDDITDSLGAGLKTTVGGGATYKLGGVTYAADASYAVATKTFTLTPTVKIVF